jgi:SAM-dependent methyltransferase
MARDYECITERESAALDALLAADSSLWWDAFYQDRAKPCPFFAPLPDESLAQWLREGSMRPGRAVDLGCGNARNAIFLAQQGFTAEGVDCSPAAIEWARTRSAQAGVALALTCADVFDVALDACAYDLVYDSGCFHHLPPHRRTRYVDLVADALKPGAWFGLACFRPEGGSGYSDDEVYERRSLGGGLGYTEERLRAIWSRRLRVRTIRQMHKPTGDSGLFGESFLWVLLAQK